MFPVFHKLHAELFHKDRVPRVLSVQAVQPLRNPTEVRLVVPLFVPIYVVHNFEYAWARVNYVSQCYKSVDVARVTFNCHTKVAVRIEWELH